FRRRCHCGGSRLRTDAVPRHRDHRTVAPALARPTRDERHVVISGVKRVPILAVLTWAVVSVSAQEAASLFEVAPVKPNTGRDLSIPFRTPPPDGISLTNNPLESIIRYAYGVQ